MDNLIFKAFIPEIFLSFSLLIQLIYNIKKTTAFKENFPLMDKEIFFQFYFILMLVLTLLLNIQIEGILSNFLFVQDTAALYLKILFIFSILLILIFIWQSFTYQNLNFFEFFIILFFSIFASLLLISCYDLLSIYLLLELQALCFYILAGIKRNSAFSSEASLKYFITGSFFSCIFLFGCLIFYGEFGTTNFYYINLLTLFPFCNGFESIYSLVVLGTTLVIITFFFKLAIVPFHFWVPEVYDGAPLSSTIILSVLPKLILFSLLIRFLSININILKNVEFLLYIGGVLSLSWGTFCALKQKRIKKLLIYSSIAQTGLIMLALATFSKDSITSVFLFLIIYNITAALGWGILTTTYGFQVKISVLKQQTALSVYFSSFNNLFKTNKLWSLIFLSFFLSLSGMPFLVGFLGKFYLFFGILQSQKLSLILFLMGIMSLSTFYYLRVLKIVFFEIQKNSKTNRIFQGNFLYLYQDISITIISCIFFFLIFSFLLPSHMILISKYISINFFIL